MEHSRGAFKSNSARPDRAVKETDQSDNAPNRSPPTQTIKIHARNLAKFQPLHKK